MTRYFSGDPVAVVGRGPVADAIVAALDAEGARMLAFDDESGCRAGDLPILVGMAIVVAPTDTGVAAAAHRLAEVERTVRSARPALASSRRGAIVMVAPGLGSEVRLGPAGFAALVGGLVGAARGWAVEMGADGIRVNVVRPGMLSTDLDLERRTPGVDLGIVPLRRGAGPRTGGPTDVATAVAFLLSEDAGYLSGAELHVDGAASQSRNSVASALWDAGLD